MITHLNHIISHRGNLNGPDSKGFENSPYSISAALDTGFEVEIDCWSICGKLFLGHDIPQFQIEENFLFDNASKLWLHAKNFEFLNFIDFYSSDYAIQHNYSKNYFNYFWHENDKVTMTSRGFFWCYPGYMLKRNSILVLPESGCLLDESSVDLQGICTDYPLLYKKDFSLSGNDEENF